MKRQTKCSDSEFMPRLLTAERCCGLDENGNRCEFKAVLETFYHGDMEAMLVRPRWVRVALCLVCAGSKVVKDANY